MRPNLIRTYGLVIVIGLACQPVWAGDRKSTPRFQESREATAVTQKGHDSSAKFELSRPLLITSLESANPVSVERRPGYLIEQSDSETRSHEHKRLILLHMNSRVGEITVQPVF